MRELLLLVFSQAGYTVESVADGQQALDKVASDPAFFHILITDHQMPGFNGVTLVRRLRQARFAGKIVVLAGALSARDHASYRELSVDSILSKPVPHAALLQTIEDLNDSQRNA